jgi:uracil-DNA glycosylase
MATADPKAHDPKAHDPKALADSLLDWWAMSGVDIAEARSALRASALAPVSAPQITATKSVSRPQLTGAPAGRMAAAPAPPSAVEDARAAAAAAQTLSELRAALEAFDGCPLKKTARNTVFSDGVENAEIMLVGEAPGKEEDEHGKPFVGRSGQLLDRMFASIGLSRETNLFISNVIFWRPPGNRPPTQGELAACLPFIRRAIEIKAPKLLVFVGGVAGQTMLQRDAGVMKLRNKRLTYSTASGANVNAMVMLHPAYLLRRPQEKRLAWADLQMLEAWAEELGVSRGERI